MAEINFGKSQTFVCFLSLLLCMLIPRSTSVSLPVRRQAVYYPTGFGVQRLIPQASTVDRIDVNQRAQFIQRVQNPNELLLVYSNNGQIPSRAQQPSFNEIFPAVRPPLNPNAVFLPRPQGGVGIGGYQPGVEPDNVLISNVRPQADAEVFTANPQPFPSGPSGPGNAFAPFNFNVQPIFRFMPNNVPQNPQTESAAEPIPESKPEKLKSSRLELVDDDSPKRENSDKTAGEQEVLAAAEKNPSLPPFSIQKSNQFPLVQPGQRFFILNGQPQFLMYQAIPYQPIQQEILQNVYNMAPNDPRYTFGNTPNEKSSNLKNQQPIEFPQNQAYDPRNFQQPPLKLQLVPNTKAKPQSEPEASEKLTQPIPSESSPQREYFSSRQVFGAPTFLKALNAPNLAFGPNPQGLEPGVNLRSKLTQESSNVEQQDTANNGVVYDYSRYTAQRQKDAKSSPREN